MIFFFDCLWFQAGSDPKQRPRIWNKTVSNLYRISLDSDWSGILKKSRFGVCVREETKLFLPQHHRWHEFIIFPIFFADSVTLPSRHTATTRPGRRFWSEISLLSGLFLYVFFSSPFFADTHFLRFRVSRIPPDIAVIDGMVSKRKQYSCRWAKILSSEQLDLDNVRLRDQQYDAVYHLVPCLLRSHGKSSHYLINPP